MQPRKMSENVFLSCTKAMQACLVTSGAELGTRWGIIYDVKSRTKCSSRRLVTSTCHLVVSTFHLVASTCHFVASTCHLVVSTCHLVASRCVSTRGAVVSSSQLVWTNHLLAWACILVLSTLHLVAVLATMHFKYQEDSGTENTNCRSSSTHVRFFHLVL